MRLQAQHLKPGSILSKGTSEIYTSLVITLLHILLIVPSVLVCDIPCLVLMRVDTAECLCSTFCWK